MGAMFINRRSIVLVLPLVALMSCKKDAVTPGVQAECPEEDHRVGYPDRDGDGFGVAEGRITPCSVLPEGYTDNSADCDDEDPDVHPDAEEICDGIDNDCDFETDEDAIDQRTFYRDSDADGHGDDDDSIEACDLPDGYVIWGGDCDESNPDVHSSAPEVCDEIDNDCNGIVDDGDEDVLFPWYPDEDEDGHGDPENPVYACSPPEGTTGSSSDCDDTDPATHLGAAEICDGADNDCDGLIDEDGCE